MLGIRILPSKNRTDEYIIDIFLLLPTLGSMIRPADQSFGQFLAISDNKNDGGHSESEWSHNFEN